MSDDDKKYPIVHGVDLETMTIDVEGPPLHANCDKCLKRVSINAILGIIGAYVEVEAHTCSWNVEMGRVRLSATSFREGMDPRSFIQGALGTQGFSLLPGGA